MISLSVVSPRCPCLLQNLVESAHRASHSGTTLVTRGSADPVAPLGSEQELSTALPTAGAFTHFGQLSGRRSNPNLQQQQPDSARDREKERVGALGRENSVTFKEGTKAEMGGGGSRGALSRENSLRGERAARLLSRENSVSSSTGALHQVGSSAAIAGAHSADALSGHRKNSAGSTEGPQQQLDGAERGMQHNATTIDLDSAP
jgi:hypothetical protein